MSEAGKHYFYHNDHLGAPQRLTDKDGAIVWQAGYDAFGGVTIEKEVVKNRLRLPGQFFDEETGLYYNWHRYYDPGTGRYVSADPIGFCGGMNLYGYVGGDPVNWVDPWGLVNINLLPKGSPGYDTAEKYNSPDGRFTVQGHGDSNPPSIYGPDGKSISPQVLADRIKGDKNYTPGQGVELVSCETGKGGDNSYAKQLAKALGDTVWAPTDVVHVVTTTNYFLGRTTKEYSLHVDNGGRYIPFSPEH
jgi:RHS repeat-associated protein